MDLLGGGDATTVYLTGLVVALTGALVHYHLKAFSFWSARGIQGPRPWPIFGTNIYYLLGNKLDIDKKWRERYGHTYGLYEGYSPLLRTTDNELLKLVYIKQFNSFTDRHGRYIYGNVQRNWLLWSKGHMWANQRALVTPMFSSSKMRNMFASMSECVNNFLASIEQRLGKSNKLATFYKTDVSNMTLQHEFMKQANDMSHISLGWFLLWLVTPPFLAEYFEINLFRQSRLEYFMRLSKQIIDDRRRSKSTKNDIIQAFMDAKLTERYEQVFSQDDDKEAHYNDQIDHKKLEDQQVEQTKSSTLFKRFSDLEIRGQMTFMMAAGFETTAISLSFCFYELSHQPKMQELLLEELKSKFKTEDLTTIDFSRDNYTDLLDAKLLDCFVSEVLRLYSPLIEHNRVVTKPEGIELPISESKKINLPCGTPISTNGYILQRDENYYEQPNKFDLMRFHPDNRDKLKTCTFMPFGLGPRNCAGMRFALLEIKLALAKIISRYELSPGPKNQSYPPKYKPNAIFLLFENTDFNMTPRSRGLTPA